MIRTPRNARVAKPHVPKATPTPGSWIVETGGGGGGGGTGGGGVPAPEVSIDPPAEVIFRSDHGVEVDVAWIAAATATPANFLGVAVYLEDPDISSGANHPLDGLSMPLDGSAQVSGEWVPIFVNDSAKPPAVIMLDSTMGFKSGKSYKTARNIRIYLAAYGPYSQPNPRRATDSNPSPNILVEIPIGRGSGESGMEWAFLVTLPDDAVKVTTDYNRVDPKYYLTLKYNPPDPSVPVPPGVNHFGGCRIVFVYEDADGNPLFPGTDTGMNIPVAQSDAGFKSDAYTFGNAGKFRVYFVSEDDSQPLGNHINSLTEGTTPYAYAVIPGVPGTPNVANFTISDQKTVWQLDGSFVAQATFAWSLPDAAAGNIRYAGVYLYLVKVTGTGTPLSPFPKDLSGGQSNTEANFILDIGNVPATPETWTIAAISYNINGSLKEHPEDYDPATYPSAKFSSPIVTWNIGPPTPGSAGSGTEHAPLVTINPGAAATATQTLSTDGVGMVSFNVGPWTNPDDNQFGNAQIAMVVNRDTTKPTFWTVPANATSFQTPAIPSFGNIGAQVPVDFYLVSDDPQGNKNSLIPNITPKIGSTYAPTQGAIIPARSGWFDDTQFSWITDPLGSGRTVMSADNITANNIYVGKTLVVGGAPDTSFAGQANGQIAVKNSTGVLRAWMGEQQPNQGMNGPPLWGAWFGQIWVGGTSPLDAPLWIDNQGIIQVGGIAAAQGSKYPYISVRDQHGYEFGRIGASLTVPSGSPGDGVGPNPPPQLTAGAWFTQLAIGGANISNWNVLVIPDPNNPLGSQFQIRNVNRFWIDYPAQFGSPANNEYILEFGNSVWMAGGLTGGWQFPGIHIYEVDNSGNNFGATFLNRGMVLRGHQTQGYQVLASLVMYNGLSSGADLPDSHFWGELTMYSPIDPTKPTVYLASGSKGNGASLFRLSDVSNNQNFFVDQVGNVYITGVLKGKPAPNGADTPINALAYNVNGYGPVIDAAGNWVGKAIAAAGGQTPWTQNINASGFSLNGAGNISASQYVLVSSGNVVIDTNGTFHGAGVACPAFGISCGSLQLNGGPIDGVGTLTSNTINTNNLNSNNGYTGGSFRGAGVNCPGYGIGCSYLQLNGGTIDSVGTLNSNAINTNSVQSGGGYTGGSFRGAGVSVGSYGIGCGGLTANGPISCYSIGVSGAVNCVSLQIQGTQRIDSFGIYRGSLQWPDHCYANDFGVYGVSAGWNGGFYDRDGIYHVVRGGIITNS